MAMEPWLWPFGEWKNTGWEVACNVEQNGMGSYCLMATKFQFATLWWMFSDENILEMDGGNGCTTMWMYLMPLKLKW